MILASDAVIIPHSPSEIAPTHQKGQPFVRRLLKALQRFIYLPESRPDLVAGTRQGCVLQPNSTKGSEPQFFRPRKTLAFAHATPSGKARTNTQKISYPFAFPLALAITLLLTISPAHAGPDVMEGPKRAIHENPTLVDPAARSVTLNHGHKTKEVYVLLHGLSNCPTQFRQFGDILYRSGANVVIPRMPYHGYRDRMTEAQEHLTARSMIANAQATLDHAHTLGDHVTVVGLSAGGVTAAWVAQNRPDVDRVYLLAPFFSIGFLPDWCTVPTRDIFATLPNSFVFWDPRQGRNLKGSPYAYPRFSTRAMSQLIRLGTTVFAEARHTAPAVRHIEIITNPADLAVNNARTTSLVKLWQKHGAVVLTEPNPEPSPAPAGSRNPKTPTATIKLYEFPGQWDLPHDFIDPWHPDQQIDKVYPILLQQLGIKR